MPNYLVPNCYKASNVEARKCELCLNYEINLMNLLSQDQLIEDLQVDFESLKQQLLQQC